MVKIAGLVWKTYEVYRSYSQIVPDCGKVFPIFLADLKNGAAEKRIMGTASTEVLPGMNAVQITSVWKFSLRAVRYPENKRGIWSWQRIMEKKEVDWYWIWHGFQWIIGNQFLDGKLRTLDDRRGCLNRTNQLHNKYIPVFIKLQEQYCLILTVQ